MSELSTHWHRRVLSQDNPYFSTGICHPVIQEFCAIAMMICFLIIFFRFNSMSCVERVNNIRVGNNLLVWGKFMRLGAVFSRTSFMTH